jgi:hypothetical protein
MSRIRTNVFALLLLLLGAALALSACGGGGSSSSTTTPVAGTVSGVVVKGPVSGSTVSAYGVNANGTMGPMLGSATTDAFGQFMLSIGNYAGPLMLKTSGGSYTDEAAGVNMTMRSGDMMTAAIPAIAAGSMVENVHITPLTSMAEAMAEHMTGGLSDANITMANGAVSAYFMVDDIVHTRPINPLVAGSAAGASTAMKNYGMALAAMSQYARNVGIMPSSAMVTAFMDDASDGVMDGVADGGSIAMGGAMMGGMMMTSSAGTGGLAGAMSDFIASGFNASGVMAADMAALMQQLIGSDGHMMH